LRPLVQDDCQYVCRWMTSAYMLQHSFVVAGATTLPHDFGTKEYAKRYFDQLLNDQKRVSFAIIFDDQPIGSIGLKDISKERASAECYIEIGEKNRRGLGLGSLAMSKILNHAFFELLLNRIDLEVLEFNFPALKMYQRLGFISHGTSCWHYDEFGQYWRVLRMTMSRATWRQCRPAA
ncbi:MAG TPA: GNAT family N-acetyltransferase, partial [Myxococcota bacterium]|nr:GNAT family N-acetyltransferase [Myxococcota bacterium]